MENVEFAWNLGKENETWLFHESVLKILKNQKFWRILKGKDKISLNRFIRFAKSSDYKSSSKQNQNKLTLLTVLDVMADTHPQNDDGWSFFFPVDCNPNVEGALTVKRGS